LSRGLPLVGRIYEPLDEVCTKTSAPPSRCGLGDSITCSLCPLLQPFSLNHLPRRTRRLRPRLGLEAELSLTRPLGVWAGGAYFLSGTWDLEAGPRWHLSPQLALSLQALFLFDVLDGFGPQLGAGVRWSFPLTPTGSWRFFNEVGLYVPLKERFVQPFYEAGIFLRF